MSAGYATWLSHRRSAGSSTRAARATSSALGAARAAAARVALQPGAIPRARAARGVFSERSASGSPNAAPSAATSSASRSVQSTCSSVGAPPPRAAPAAARVAEEVADLAAPEVRALHLGRDDVGQVDPAERRARARVATHHGAASAGAAATRARPSASARRAREPARPARLGVPVARLGARAGSRTVTITHGGGAAGASDDACDDDGDDASARRPSRREGGARARSPRRASRACPSPCRRTRGSRTASVVPAVRRAGGERLQESHEARRVPVPRSPRVAHGGRRRAGDAADQQAADEAFASAAATWATRHSRRRHASRSRSSST